MSNLIRILLLMLLAALLAVLLLDTLNSPVSFDGAMNLEVAYSLSEGNGYRRTYADREAFPHEIQTHAPFILPSAVAFALFGVGPGSAQATNLVYLAALVIVLWLGLRRIAGSGWALAAAVAVVGTPHLQRYGMNGYGELIALFWWLWGTERLLVSRAPPNRGGLLLAGVLLGLALATKTVLLIGVAASGFIFAISRDWRFPLRAIQSGAWVCAGIALPLALFECWKFVSLGSEAYSAWWTQEAGAILSQAGVKPGFTDSSGPFERVVAHAAVLAEVLGVSVWLLAFSALALAAGLARALAKDDPLQARALLAAVALTTALYAIWWLGITPTEKAWYRRIFNGVVLFQLLSVLTAAALARVAMRLSGFRRARTNVLLLAVLLGPAAWSAVFWHQRLTSGAATDLDETLKFAMQVAKIPEDALILGYKWYSAPTVALYSGRHIQNLHHVAPAAVDMARPAYLVLDPPALKSEHFDAVLQRYPYETVATSPAGYRLLRVRLGAPRFAFDSAARSSAAVRPCFRANEDYPFLFGFHRIEGQHRWLKADASLLLRWQGPTLTLDVYAPRPEQLRPPGETSLVVSLDGCPLASALRLPEGRHTLRLDTQSCGVADGKAVEVRIAADRVVDSADQRQLGIVLQAVGWGAMPGTQESNLCSDIAGPGMQDAPLTQPATPQSATPANPQDSSGHLR